MNRPKLKAKTVNEKATPKDGIRKVVAAMIMVGTRPKRSARRPAMIAPSAEPRSAEETARPSVTGPTLNCFWTATTAPLMTAVSKPKRKPPIAATDAIVTTRPTLGEPTPPLACGPLDPADPLGSLIAVLLREFSGSSQTEDYSAHSSVIQLS